MSKLTYAQRAGMLCQDTAFRLYLDRRASAKFNMLVPDGTHTEQCARDWLVKACGITSRKELDTNIAAAQAFCRVLHHYKRYQERTGQ